MSKSKNPDFLIQNISSLKGVGIKTKQILKRKKIEKVSDLLWNLPQGFTDRSNLKNLDSLEIGKITTVKVKVIKYNFPRIRNLPNKVLCRDEKGKIDIIFFNSREGYIRNILPLNYWVIISGKINFFRDKYQITNPAYVVPIDKEDYVKKIIPKYSLTEGMTEKLYRKLIEKILLKLPDLEEWHSPEILRQVGNKKWKESILKLHDTKNDINLQSDYYKRIAYDEIIANLLVLSQIRKKVKKIKKRKKIFRENLSNEIIKKFKFHLTNDQKKIIFEINKDLKSENKMFRLLQGDVGSGKTIVCLVAAANVIQSNFQTVFMAPTEILARQHYNLAKKIFSDTNINIEILTSKMISSDKKVILDKLKNGKINLLIGTHSLFQKNVTFKNLGLAIIDEQHKFGVKQRIDLAKKGDNDCDVLLMSATPIPRTLVLTLFGDMDVSRLIEKPANRKEILTLSKPEEKINEVLTFIKKQILIGNQIFWVCPIIEESKILDYTAAIKKYDLLKKEFKKKVGLIHGRLNKDEKENVLKKFLNKDINILVSTTVIEVGIDFPNANVIIIENSNKFGLSQLHQLRGRVGRGLSQGTCILLYKKSLSVNAIKRIKILKSTNDGFKIAEEDMKLRGFGDVLGYEQSGLKEYKIADPIHHEKLFRIAELDIKQIELNQKTFQKYEFLLKLYDKADIINKII